MSQSIEVLAVPENIPQLVAFSDSVEQALPLSLEQRYLMRLAIEEITTNIIKYSYAHEHPGPIQVACACQGERLCVIIRDRGQPFDPHDAPPPDLGSDLASRTIGGLGVYLVRELADDLTYRHDPASGWNELVVLKDNESTDV
jgi:anti-sigma regulatory factor (Ser/Thr protein kinase)